MSKSAKAYGAAGLALIAFPLLVALWSGASAILAILLIGLAAYAIAVCLLIACFWHRYQYGSWPVEFEGSALERQRYPLSAQASVDSRESPKPQPAADDEASYSVSPALLGWLRRFSSHV